MMTFIIPRQMAILWLMVGLLTQADSPSSIRLKADKPINIPA